MLDFSKYKIFADNKLNVGQMMKIVFERAEKIVGKRIKCWLKAFVLFQLCFQKPLLQLQIVWSGVLTLSQTTNFRPFQSERVCR